MDDLLLRRLFLLNRSRAQGGAQTELLGLIEDLYTMWDSYCVLHMGQGWWWGSASYHSGDSVRTRLRMLMF